MMINDPRLLWKTGRRKVIFSTETWDWEIEAQRRFRGSGNGEIRDLKKAGIVNYYEN